MLEVRTHTCGELRASHEGETVVVQGWAHAVRDRGGLAFVVLRDRHGTVQITVDERSPDEVRDRVKQVRLEYVVQVRGQVAKRAGAANKDMATGEIEVVATELAILSGTQPLPFAIHDHGSDAKEDVRLKYRYLDLRRPALQHNLVTRHRASQSARRTMDGLGFVEIETPILTRATPEGARDYLVPSRVHAGQWYALPQSPQIFKQILMVAGMDRYFRSVAAFATKTFGSIGSPNSLKSTSNCRSPHRRWYARSPRPSLATCGRTCWAWRWARFPSSPTKRR